MVDAKTVLLQQALIIDLTIAKKLLMGGGSDLDMYHDGTHSYLYNYTGDFKITSFADDKDIIFSCDDGSNGTTPYFYLDASANAKTVFPQSILVADSKSLEWR